MPRYRILQSGALPISCQNQPFVTKSTRETTSCHKKTETSSRDFTNSLVLKNFLLPYKNYTLSNSISNILLLDMTKQMSTVFCQLRLHSYTLKLAGIALRRVLRDFSFGVLSQSLEVARSLVSQNLRG